MLKEAVQVTALTIAGERVTGGETMTVRSPWDGHPVGTVPVVGAKETKAAIDGAVQAMQSPLPAAERALILDRAAATIRERREDLARLLSEEAGKPLKQALIEVDRCVQTLIFSAVEARTLAGRGIPLDAHPSGEGRLGFTIRVPVGVVAAITPFNFPLNLVAHKVGPAVAAGCAIVLKPSLKTPLAGIALAEILYEAGLPRQWISTLNGPPEAIVDALVEDDRVAMITFTGSSQVGWSLAARAPRKRVTLELGNATPLIVCEDGDLDAAAQAAATSGFGFAGQSCISVQRVLVHRALHDAFVERLVTAAEKQVLGDPTSPETTLGPVIEPAARDRIVEWVDEAVKEGAVKCTGGTGDNGHLRPVVLDQVGTEMRVWKREVFGPVVAVRAFDDLDEAISLANGTEYGLQAGVYTRNLATALAAVEKLQFGGVTVNETPTFRVDQMPYGGTKESGNTREGPHYTVREMTEERMVVIRP